MAIGRFDLKHAAGVGELGESIRIALDEALTALAESFSGLMGLDDTPGWSEQHWA